MAERRMFAKTIIDSDAFIDMPMSARLLYYDLGMRADDDGFVNSPRKIMKFVGASEDDMRILSGKKFVIPFDSGIVVIKHWKIHNYIRKDTYTETKYKGEKAQLYTDENNAYSTTKPLLNSAEETPSTIRGRDVDDPLTQVRLGKDSIVKDSTDSADKPRRFVKPTAEEVEEYCTERGNKVNAQNFVDFYESKGWKVGGSPMKDWKAAVRTWEQRDKAKAPDKKMVRYIHPDENGNPTEGWREV